MAMSDLIGCSPRFCSVLREVALVAPTGCAVLLQGETGTGKEVIARAIHDASPRRGGPFVALNCAAIPATLLESELFGHERGAFTGAMVQTIGRLQAAHGGTLFLDEIGDLPVELQPKLLRVLQEQQFERLGSSRSLNVDMRLIAATNRDLWGMVQDRTFRADLYYRLNVFPIELPPLRDRQSDIPLFVNYFVRKFSAQMEKSIDHVPDPVMEVLRNYSWPGNIREMQNVIERAVILSPGCVLCLPPSYLKSWGTRGPVAVRTMAEAERLHILEALRESNGVVGGAGGAAARLGLPRTTLMARMEKLGISRTAHSFTVVPIERRENTTVPQTASAS
jgi:formate hydrogenlyase transcriptional activator